MSAVAFEEAWAVGSLMNHDQAIAYALEDAPTPEILTDANLTETTSHNALLSLAHRELDILRLIAEGYTNAEIANQLVLAISRVKWYVSQILDKLEVANRTQAVAQARSLGLIT